MHNICIDSDLRLLQLGSSATTTKSDEKYDNKTRNLYDRPQTQAERKKEEQEREEEEVASEAKEIHSSGALKSFKLVLRKMRKTKKWWEGEKESE